MAILDRSGIWESLCRAIHLAIQRRVAQILSFVISGEIAGAPYLFLRCGLAGCRSYTHGGRGIVDSQEAVPESERLRGACL